jgi:hypothetical protein
MQHEQPVRTQTEDSATQRKKNLPNHPIPAASESNWQLKVLMAVIGLGVLMLVLKAVGVV